MEHDNEQILSQITLTEVLVDGHPEISVEVSDGTPYLTAMGLWAAAHNALEELYAGGEVTGLD